MKPGVPDWMRLWALSPNAHRWSKLHDNNDVSWSHSPQRTSATAARYRHRKLYP